MFMLRMKFLNEHHFNIKNKSKDLTVFLHIFLIESEFQRNKNSKKIFLILQVEHPKQLKAFFGLSFFGPICSIKGAKLESKIYIKPFLKFCKVSCF